MPFYIRSDIGSLIARNRRRIANITPAMVAAEKINMEEIRQKAIANTSYSSYVVGSLAPIYPYSHRDNSPPMAPYFANIQTNGNNEEKGMAQSWKTRVVVTPIGITSSIWNEKPYSRFFDGAPTSKMIARDVMGYILYRTDVRVKRLKRLAEAHRRYLEEK